MGQRLSRVTAVEIAGVALALGVLIALLLLVRETESGGGNGPTPPDKRIKPGLYYINGHLQTMPWTTFADAIEACYVASAGASVATAEDVAKCTSPTKAKPQSPSFVASGRTVDAVKQSNVPKYLWDAPLPEYVYLKVYPKGSAEAKGGIQIVTMQFSKAASEQDAFVGVPSDAKVTRPGAVALGTEAESVILYKVRYGTTENFTLVIGSGPMVGNVLFAAIVPSAKSPASFMLQHAYAPNNVPPENLATTLFSHDEKSGKLFAVHGGGSTKSPLFIDGTLPGAVYTPFANPSKFIKPGRVMATFVTLKVQK